MEGRKGRNLPKNPNPQLLEGQKSEVEVPTALGVAWFLLARVCCSGSTMALPGREESVLEPFWWARWCRGCAEDEGRRQGERSFRLLKTCSLAQQLVNVWTDFVGLVVCVSCFP